MPSCMRWRWIRFSVKYKYRRKFAAARGAGWSWTEFRFLIKDTDYDLHVFGQVGPGLGCDVIGDAVQGSGDAASYGSNGVAVATQRDRVAVRIFKAVGVQGAADGLGHRVDGFFCALVGGADLVRRQVQWISKPVGDALTNVGCGHLLTCPVDGQGHRLRGEHGVRVVVGDGGHGVRPADHFFFVAGEQTHRRDAHGCAVASAAIGLGVVVQKPEGELFAPSAVFCVALAPFNEGGLRVRSTRQRIGNRHGANRVIGEAGLRVKQRGKVFAFEVRELVGRADDVAEHDYSFEVKQALTSTVFLESLEALVLMMFVLIRNVILRASMGWGSVSQLF